MKPWLPDDVTEIRPDPSPEHGSLESAVAQLKRLLRLSSDRTGVCSYRASVGDPNLFQWLSRQAQEPLFYFADRSRREEVATIGAVEAVRIEGPATMQCVSALLEKQMHLASDGRRLYGGLRFNPNVSRDGSWDDFAAAQFFVPRIEMRRIGLRAELWVHADMDSADDVDRACEALDAVSLVDESAPGEPAVDASTRVDLPNYAQWQVMIGNLLTRIRSGEIEKAVLARAAAFDAPVRLDPRTLFDRVRATAPHCYHIYFEPTAGTAFMCATPERLFRRTGNRLVSEAVAGTRPRGLLAADDARYRDELLTSDKDRREHAVVGRSIIKALEPLCSRIELDTTPSEMRLRGNRHLKSVVRATLNAGVSTAGILEAIHPTPAVGGCPTQEALDIIDAVEPFDRGWYAGAIGWVGEDEAELAVGIRSALVRDNRVTLYSGAGIVEGSEADAEWNEIEQKIETFLNVIATPTICDETTIRG